VDQCRVQAREPVSGPKLVAKWGKFTYFYMNLYLKNESLVKFKQFEINLIKCLFVQIKLNIIKQHAHLYFTSQTQNMKRELRHLFSKQKINYFK
jgi:hypothetical protein